MGAVDGIEHVDCVQTLQGRSAREDRWPEAGLHLVEYKVIIVRTEHEVMRDTACVEFATDLGSQRKILRLIVGVAALARKDLPVAEEGLWGSDQFRILAGSYEVRRAITPAREEAPLVVEVVLKLSLMAPHIEPDRSVARFAEITAGR